MWISALELNLHESNFDLYCRCIELFVSICFSGLLEFNGHNVGRLLGWLKFGLLDSLILLCSVDDGVWVCSFIVEHWMYLIDFFCLIKLSYFWRNPVHKILSLL